MKKFLAFLALVALLGTITVCGILAENSSEAGNISGSTSDTEGEQVDTESDTESTVSLESIGGSVSMITSDTEADTESETVSSRRYGANATDQATDVSGSFGDPVNDASVDLTQSTVTTNGEHKDIFDLSKLLSYLIVIPIILAIGSVAALIKVNSKSYLGEAETAKEKAKKQNKKKSSKNSHKPRD